jgi:hypothetical protein
MIDNDTITNWKKKFIKSTNIETWLSYNYFKEALWLILKS